MRRPAPSEEDIESGIIAMGRRGNSPTDLAPSHYIRRKQDDGGANQMKSCEEKNCTGDGLKSEQVKDASAPLPPGLPATDYAVWPSLRLTFWVLHYFD